MESVVRHGNDRDFRVFSVFAQKFFSVAVLRNFVFQYSDAEPAGVTTHNICRVFNCFARRFCRFQSHTFRLEKLGVPAKLSRRAFKTLTRAHRWIIEKHKKTSVFQNVRITVTIFFHFDREVENGKQFFKRPVLRNNQVASF